MNRSDLELLPAQTDVLRSVRNVTAEELEDVTNEELENAVRWMRAAAYSARVGASKLEGILNERKR